MTVKVTKPAVNLREELADLRKPTGIAGEAMLRAETPQEQFNLIGAGRRNLIINGDMQVAQRGTSSSTGTSNAYSTVDRIKHNTSLPSGVSTLTYSQDTDAPDGFGYSYKVTPDQSATAALTGGNRSIAMTIIEAQDLQQLGFGSSDAKPFTLSFWIKSNLTGTFTLELESPDSGSSYLFFTKALTINTSGVWEYKTVTIPPHVNGTMNNDNDVGLVVAFWLAAGPTFTSGGNPSDGSWHSSPNANRADPSNINIYSSSSNYVQITGVQLELGKVATPFEHRSYGEELALCQRYFERQSYLAFSKIAIGYSKNGTNADSVLLYTEKRDVPEITLPAASKTNGITYLTSTDSFPATVGTNTAVLINKHSCRISASGYSTLSSGSPSALYVIGDQVIDINAEL